MSRAERALTLECVASVRLGGISGRQAERSLDESIANFRTRKTIATLELL